MAPRRPARSHRPRPARRHGRCLRRRRQSINTVGHAWHHAAQLRLENHELRVCPGPDYDTDLESVAATLAVGQHLSSTSPASPAPPAPSPPIKFTPSPATDPKTTPNPPPC